MPQAQHSVTIKRPPEAVFAYLLDGEKCTEWRSGRVARPSWTVSMLFRIMKTRKKNRASQSVNQVVRHSPMAPPTVRNGFQCWMR